MRQTLIAAIVTAWLVVAGTATFFVMRPETPRFVKFLLLGFLS